MMNFTAEMIEKAKTAESVEQLLEIAKANAVEMTPAEAATYFAQLNPVTGELSDDDLDAVSGGASGCSSPVKDGDAVRVINGDKCKNCGGVIGKFMAGSAAFYPCVLCTSCNKGANCYVITAYPELGIDMELL